MSTMPTISPSRAAELVRAGAVLVDIREADEYAREHIPGARHHPLTRIHAQSPARSDATCVSCASWLPRWGSCATWTCSSKA